MLWFAYNVLFTVGYLLMLPRFLCRMWRRGGYRKDFMQRLGCYTPDVRERLSQGGRLWVHAVSVGELFVALRFMDELRSKRPGTAFVLTTTTSTGHRLAEERLSASDVLLYFPTDFPRVVERVLDTVRPRGLVLTECELWPNLIRKAHARGIPVVLINGRISASSYRGYRKGRVFIRRVLAFVDLMLVQSRLDAQRLTDLGADASRVEIVGSAKYDLPDLDAARSQAVRAMLERCGMAGGGTRVMMGGSTWSGEESALLGIYRELRREMPELRLLLVPRHAERAHEVAEEIRAAGLSCALRSDVPDEQPPAAFADVLLVDTTGELRYLYAHADVVFVGKSLANRGGQNMIEPAALSRAVIVGPHTANFPVVVREMLEADALVQVASVQELAETFGSLLRDEERRHEQGKRAGALVRSKRGVVARSVARMLPVMEQRKDCPP